MRVNQLKLLKKISFIIIFLFFIGGTIPAQPELDSLWNVWNDENTPDSSRALALSKFCWDGYLFSQPDSAFYYAQLLYDFGEERNIKKTMARALNIQGVSFYIRSDYVNAMNYYQLSLEINRENNDNSALATNLNNIGLIYSRKGYNTKALDYYQQCLKIYEEVSDKVRMVGVLNNIGVIYVDHEDFNKGLEYFHRCLNISEEISNKKRMAVAMNNIGLCYSNLGNYSIALDYYSQSLNVNEEINNRRGLASVLDHIGEMYKNKGEYLKALEYFNRCLIISEEISDERGMVGSMNYMGESYNYLGDHRKAIKWCEKSLQIAEEMNVIEEQEDACKCLYNAHKALGNSKKALQYHELSSTLNDSLQAAETAKKLQQMEFAKQVLADSLKREEDKLIVQLTHEREIKNKKMTRNIFFAIAILFFISAIGIYMRIHLVRRAKKAITKEKERSDKLLDNILPSKIADELIFKGKAEAKNFNKVTILFSNFKGFTRISEQLSAEELVEEINSCFEPFDEICRKYGIEKIKTIGDAYMAAGGVPVPSDSAAKNTVLAALEMMSCINKKKDEKKLECQLCFEMRIGIHTGPVVAGIVGSSKFHYDIWGDAVNIASRIEDAGEVGKVNISQSTYELIKNEAIFRFVQRGKIMTKGKGEIEMWFVEKVGL